MRHILNFLKSIYRLSVFKNEILFNKLHLAKDDLKNYNSLFFQEKKEPQNRLWLKDYTYGKVTIRAFELDLPNTL